MKEGYSRRMTPEFRTYETYAWLHYDLIWNVYEHYIHYDMYGVEHAMSLAFYAVRMEDADVSYSTCSFACDYTSARGRSVDGTVYVVIDEFVYNTWLVECYSTDEDRDAVKYDLPWEKVHAAWKAKDGCVYATNKMFKDRMSYVRPEMFLTSVHDRPMDSPLNGLMNTKFFPQPRPARGQDAYERDLHEGRDPDQFKAAWGTPRARARSSSCGPRNYGKSRKGGKGGKRRYSDDDVYVTGKGSRGRSPVRAGALPKNVTTAIVKQEHAKRMANAKADLDKIAQRARSFADAWYGSVTNLPSITDLPRDGENRPIPSTTGPQQMFSAGME